ncbi:hypothetical protein NQ315_009318 [Exocentrus adspersus]|uniref:Uncharacterized protein n=1 Tax=Exocentrus adspersus TaxID=1586481 RepID=A0AAV8WFF5_9CUCU|nr:hypothetical protein NQ315_009318 [Exocentrus adspersus]
MYKFFAVSICTFALAVANEQSGQDDVILDLDAEASQNYNSYSGHGYPNHYDGNYGKGAELTGLAHNSAIQAKNLLLNQHAAGNQAAYGVKSSFATAVLGAAKAAHAAVIGKQALLSSLKKQLAEAQHQLQGELAQYKQTEAAAQLAQDSAKQAHSQLNSLTAALAEAQGRAHHANQAALEAGNSAAAQHAMVIEAKQRIAQIIDKLQSTSKDLQDTEVSAQKAAEAAQIAHSNAAAAGADVKVAAAKGGHYGYSNGYY